VQRISQIPEDCSLSRNSKKSLFSLFFIGAFGSGLRRTGPYQGYLGWPILNDWPALFVPEVTDAIALSEKVAGLSYREAGGASGLNASET
jgi:hypothetical protein